jgi:hypothetical protein
MERESAVGAAHRKSSAVAGDEDVQHWRARGKDDRQHDAQHETVGLLALLAQLDKAGE